uniref:Ig-like domain-containing protein n=1 Tax=Nonlabens xiamenensis TaxID=2341043 RepID=UPI000F606445
MKNVTKFLVAFMLLLGFTSLAQPNIRVRGVGIDIWNVNGRGTDRQMIHRKGIKKDWETWPRFSGDGNAHVWVGQRPALITDKDYATTPVYGSIDDDHNSADMESFSVDQSTTIYIAVPLSNMNAPGWTRTSTNFFTSITTYHVYSYDYDASEGWVDFPYFDRDSPTIIFGEKQHVFFDNPLPLSDLAEGVLIRETGAYYNRDGFIVDPHLTILPNGDYIAGQNNRRFKSTDKGLTWTEIVRSYDVRHSSTFEHNGDLYIIGDADNLGAIIKSTDGGDTWSSRVFLNFYLRNSPCRVEKSQGRVWLSAQPPALFFVSADLSDDLMDPNSWTTTANPDGVESRDEPDMLLDRDGWPVIMPKAGPPIKAVGLSATQRMFESSEFNLPMSGSKYSCIYDPVSDKFWALTSKADFYDGEGRRPGITLYSSTDLKSWTREREVLHGVAPAFHGFNYPSMQIEGDDIIFVSRTAWENEKGQAVRWHDANMLTFHRVRDFRATTTCAIVPYSSSNNIDWQTNGIITVDAGDDVSFGPQSTVDGSSGGNWSWTGPNGFTANTREITFTNVQPADIGTYTVTDISSDNCESSYDFYINITGNTLPPRVSFTAPAEGATFTEGANIGTVVVSAIDPDGNIANVNLYLDGSATSIRQENGFPYEWNAPGQNDPALQTLSAGTHTLRAVAVDNEGATGEAEITITIIGENENPTVSFATPVDGATFTEGDNIGTVDVTATDSDGSISNVNLYLDGSTTSIRQENGAPYLWNAPGQNDPALQTLSAGTHTLRAVAVDNEGAIGEAT